MVRKIIVILLLLLSVAIAVGLYVRHDFVSSNSLEQEVTVVLPRGSGFVRSVAILAENQVIKNPLLFKAIAYLSGDARKIKAGEYAFPAKVSPQQVLSMLMEGKVVQHKITIAEGLNIREISEILRAEPDLVGDIPGNLAEGSLFPDTYYFVRGDSRESVIAEMQEKMQKILSELWGGRAKDLPLASKEEALILASIVEKETGAVEERRRVAAVFVNRLKIGMPLQSDPTVVYGIEKQTGEKFSGSLIIPDLRTPTPYNTYTINALPPTPIANPGKAAIEAVLHPASTKELYFVATGKGGHNFAESLEEHNRNVREYRKRMTEFMLR